MVWELSTYPMEGLIHILEKERRIPRGGGVISTVLADHGSLGMPPGKMMIYNENLEKVMPGYIRNREGAYPLRLVAVPSAYTLDLVFMDREDLGSDRGLMTLMFHPRDAMARKIVDGSHVAAFNELVKVEFTAKVTPVVAEGTAAARSVYNRTFTEDGLLVNTLHHEQLSDIGVATTLNDNTVDVWSCQGRQDNRKRDRAWNQ